MIREDIRRARAARRDLRPGSGPTAGKNHRCRLRSGREMATRLRRYPGWSGAASDFDFKVLAPRLPAQCRPSTPRGWLPKLVAPKAPAPLGISGGRAGAGRGHPDGQGARCDRAPGVRGLLRGRIERAGGAVNLVAAGLRPLRVIAAVASRDLSRTVTAVM